MIVTCVYDEQQTMKPHEVSKYVKHVVVSQSGTYFFVEGIQYTQNNFVRI